MVALGTERTIEQDSGVRDPDHGRRRQQSAVGGDQRSDLGGAGDGSPRRCPADDRHDRPIALPLGGRARLARTGLLVPVRRWEDYLALGTTEPRRYGATSIQVMRRMRAMLYELRDEVRPENRAAVQAEIAQARCDRRAHVRRNPSISIAPAPPIRRGSAGRRLHAHWHLDRGRRWWPTAGDQKIATGFSGEPVPPTIRSGAVTSRNSQRPVRSHSEPKILELEVVEQVDPHRRDRQHVDREVDTLGAARRGVVVSIRRRAPRRRERQRTPSPWDAGRPSPRGCSTARRRPAAADVRCEPAGCRPRATLTPC